MNKPTESAISIVEGQIDFAEREIKQFASKLSESPEQAFLWGDSAVAATAKVMVGKQVLTWLKSGSLVEAVDSAQKLAFHHARFPRKSTSQMANIMYAAEATAWAEMAIILMQVAK